MKNTARYIHEESAHNLNDPQIIVPILVEVLKPKNVVDLGCGIGTFLNIFKKLGVTDVLGLDGEWVDKEKLSKNIDLKYFKQVNIEEKISIDRKYDLAICLEVFEHIKEEYTEIAVQSLTNLSDVIVFSASIPGQVGQNHVNEEWFDYWEEKFKKHGYVFYDVFRPIFWNNKNLARWYKQNMFLVVKNSVNIDCDKFSNYFDNNIKNYVHPEYFLLKMKEIYSLTEYNQILNEKINSIQKGKLSFIYYLKLVLKYFRRRLLFFRKT